jgi:protein-disulfide isomerase
MRNLFITGAVLCAGLSFGQEAKPRPMPVPKNHPPASTAAALPTEQEVNAFMQRMFGQDPSVKWTVADIEQSEMAGVAKVVVTIGNRPTTLYVMPGGHYAIAGEVIPFGADPFAPAREKLARANGPAQGADNAAVTLVEFSDLQCPHCKAAQPVIERLMADNPNARLVFENFPLEIHDWALKAAEYGDCIGRENPAAFWKFAASVYDAQNDITAANADEKLEALAQAAGANVASLPACVANAQTYVRVQQSIQLGKDLGVTGTPTLFINGRKVVGVADVPYDSLNAMVKFEAEEAAKK